MSAKNALQELLMKQGKPLPVYHTVQSGPSHQPTFISTCTALEKSWAGENGATRKQAEQSAANLALRSFSAAPPPPARSETKVPVEGAQCVVLIDADNVDVGAQLARDFPGAVFVFYVSKNGTKEGGLQAHAALSNCHVHKAPMIGKDACDVFMVYEARHFRDVCPDACMAIVTKDHFGASLAFLAAAMHLCSESELENWLPHASSGGGEEGGGGFLEHGRIM